MTPGMEKALVSGYDQALARIPEALKTEGFGVLTEIDVADTLKKKLGVEYNEISADGKFTVKEGECFGACGDAPLVLVDHRRMCSKMSAAQIDKLISELQ